MNHQQVIERIDQYIAGQLDLVEWHEFVAHKRQCRTCAIRLDERQWECLDDRGTLVADEPKPCLTDATLRRWAAGELSAELQARVFRHLADCESCFVRADGILEATLALTETS